MELMHTLFRGLTDQQAIKRREILLNTLVALLAMTLLTLISHRFLGDGPLPFIVASMGASTVLLAAIPSSPMNRAWPMLGSHVIAALIGVSCALYIPNILFAIPLAVTTSILAMQILRCIHPPGGATALLTVLAAQNLEQFGYQFVLTPVLLNALVLWGAVRAITFLLEVHQEQERLEWPAQLPEQRALELKPPFELEDLKAALEHFNTFIDINQKELMRLYQEANHHYHRRHLGDLRCSDLMLPHPVAAEFATPLAQAWDWLNRHQLSAIPVVNVAHHPIGIITLDDFIRHAKGLPQTTLDDRIQALITPTPGPNSEKAEVVGQVMSQPVITSPDNAPVAELLALLDEKQIQHLPIVNEKGKLVGVLSRNQIVAILEQGPPSGPD